MNKPLAMQTVTILIAQVKEMLIQTDGQKPRHELYNHFINECKALNLTEDDFYKKVLAPASRSINWEQVAEEKKVKAEQGQAAKEAAEKLEAQQAALKYLHQQIKSAFDNGVLGMVELNEVFKKAEETGQDIYQLTDYIDAQIQKNGFKPFPAADQVSSDTKTKLLSANWYDEWNYKKLSPPLASPTQSSSTTVVLPPLEKSKSITSSNPQRSRLPESKQKKSSNAPLLTVIILLLAAGGLITYFIWWKPYIRDRDAPRMYCFANNLWLRSTPMATGTENTIQNLDYGTEVLIYESMQEWSRVKAKGYEGYVKSSYLLEKKKLYELNSIFADIDSRNGADETRARRALLDYFQSHNIIGKMEASLQIEFYGSVQQKEVWQLFAKERKVKPNTVFFKKIIDPQSKFNDFAFLLTNLSTQKRKFVLYHFSDTEEPQFVYEEDAPDQGDIVSISPINLSKYTYSVQYTSQ